MTFLQKLVVLTALAVAIALAGLTRPGAGTRLSARLRPLPGWPPAAWLAVMMAALMVVGIVSHTLLRHVVQVAPLLVAVGMSFRGSRFAAAAAAPLFAFWFLMMTSIWLFLLGIARIFIGRFTPVEITLTIIIGIASVFGLVSACVRGASALTAGRVGTLVGFAVLQLAAMWVSLQPFVARR
jgi:hypothetical protein